MAFGQRITLTLLNVFKISKRSVFVGKPTQRILSKRPGLNMAGSMMSGLLVAASRKQFLDSKPSISVSNWLTTREE